MSSLFKKHMSFLLSFCLLMLISTFFYNLSKAQALDKKPVDSYAQDDAQLNKSYKEIKKRVLNREEGVKDFIKAQRNWLRFRDSVCHFRLQRCKNSKLFQQLYRDCLDDLTKKRLKDFKYYLTCQETWMGCPTWVPSKL